MNNKGTVTIIASIVIVTNIATFLFAQARARLVEGARMAEKAVISEGYVGQDKVIDKKISAVIKPDKKSGAYRDFDDSGRYVIGAPYTDAEQSAEMHESGNSINGGEAEAAADPKAAIEAGVMYPVNTTDSAGKSPTQPQYAITDIPARNDDDEPMSNQNIQVPQLPPLDEDYDIPADDAGLADIPLPELPDSG